jgi:hypothetical protein
MNLNGTGANAGILAQVDPLFQALRVSHRPIDVTGGGWFSQALVSGALTGVAAGGSVFQFRMAAAGVFALVRRIRLSALTTTAFTSTQQQLDFALYVARSYTVNGTGGNVGTLSGNTSKYRTSYSEIQATDLRIASTAALGAGTWTLDSSPLSYMTGWSGGLGTGILQPAPILQYDAEDHPLVLNGSNEEGLNIEMITAMGTGGVIKLYIDIEWAEVTSY